MASSILALLIVLLASACDYLKSDLRIHNGYYVDRINDSYYLYNENDTSGTPGGVISGMVLEIGWDEKYIVVKRQKIAGADRDWLVIEAATRTNLGPYENREALPEETKNIKIHDAKYAWKNL